ncbi:MAG: FG-GAP repeat domain-containing protein [Mangrovibacterium sp.]
MNQANGKTGSDSLNQAMGSFLWSGRQWFLTVLLSCGSLIAIAQRDNFPNWKHFSIDPILPGSSWGTSGPIIADFDHDGDLDAIVARRVTREAYWYERRNDSIWIPHLVGQLGDMADGLGCTGIDMDGDGWTDAVFEGVWFKNPGNLTKYPDTPWILNHYKGGGHDIVSCDIDGDGKDDLIVYDGNKLSVFNPSDKMRETVISSGHHDHGGIAPHGFGDLDGDQDPDLVIPGFWFANPGNRGGNWVKHEWPFDPVPNASYGRSIRAWIADINKDGKNDLVYSHCDTGFSHVYWVENKDNGINWIAHQLADPPTRQGDVEGTGSFHSLGVADFNQDGFPDIFAGEQEDPDQMWGKLKPMKPKGLKERGVIWYHNGNKNPGFSIFVIHIDNPGWHDAQLGDVDGDGDIDIVSKVWNADGPVYHLDYWRNELK